MRFPPSVFPLWKPPFPSTSSGSPLEDSLRPDSPFSKADSTKGGKPQGANARRPFWKTAQNRRRVGGFFQRRFQPPPYGGPAPPPLNQPRCARPQSWGQRVGRAETGCGRSGPRTVSALRGRRRAATSSPPKTLRGGSFLRSQKPPESRRARTRQPSRQPANDRGLSCRLLTRPKRMRTLLVFAAGRKRGGKKTKSVFGKRGGERNGG